MSIEGAPRHERAAKLRPAADEGGEQAAGGMRAIFLHNRARLRSFLLHNGAGDATDDLLQELWIKLLKMDRGPIADPRSYLFRVAYNLLVDHRRAVARAARRDWEWSDVAGPTEFGISDQPSSERVLSAQQALRVVDQRLAALGEPGATIFRRHRLEGRTQRAIASELGISISTVEKHLRKAYAVFLKLRGVLGEV